MIHFDRNKSLEELDGETWGEPSYDSGLVIECHRLRRIPLRAFSAEHLRLMIGQQIGLPYLVPLALELLRADPFTSGDCYEGDLLMTMLRAKLAFWRERPELRREVEEIVGQAFTLLPSLDDSVRTTVHDSLTEAHHVFQRI